MRETELYRDCIVSNSDLNLQVLQIVRTNARKTVLFNQYRLPNGNLDDAIESLNVALQTINHADRKDIVIYIYSQGES